MKEFHVSFPRKDFPRLTHFGFESGGATSFPLPHYHYGYELFFFTAGGGDITLTKNAPPVTIRPYDLIIIAPEVEHCFIAPSEKLAYYWLGMQTGKRVITAQHESVIHYRYAHRNSPFKALRFTEEIDQHLSGIGGHIGVSRYAVIQAGVRCEFIFSDIREELTRERMYAREIIYHRVSELLARVTRLLSEGAAGPEDMPSRAKAYIEAHMHEPASLADIAQHCGVHPSYVSRKFKAVFGETITDYANRLRVDAAKRLLADGRSVSETARALGFGTVFYFSAMFKKYTGLVPSSFIRTR